MIRHIRTQFGRLIHEEDGPTAVEYAVMLSLIIVVCIGSVRSMSTATRSSLDASAQAIGTAMGP